MPKEKIAISIDPALLKWIDSQVQIHKFANRSHAIEYAIAQVRKGQ